MERTLLARGVVSAGAVAHARALQARGYEQARLEELLVDLGHVDPEALAQAFAAETGTERWAEDDFDPDAARSIGERRALIVRREGRTVFFATTAPYDEALADQARFATGATRAVPLVTTEAALQRGHKSPSSDKLGGGEPDAVERLTNLLLLDHVIGAPGACARIRDFEPPGIDVGENGCFDERTPEGWDTLPPVLHASMSRRLRYMAVGDHRQDDVDGWITLCLSPNGRPFSMQLFGRRTVRGGVVVLQRQACWSGDWPEAAEWEKWRQCVQAMRVAHQKKDALGLVAAAESAVRAADAIGPRGNLETDR